MIGLKLNGLASTLKKEELVLEDFKKKAKAKESALWRNKDKASTALDVFIESLLETKKEDILFLVNYGKKIEIEGEFFAPEGYSYRTITDISLVNSGRVDYPNCIRICGCDDEEEYGDYVGFLSYGFLDKDISAIKKSYEDERAEKVRLRDERLFEELKSKLGK